MLSKSLAEAAAAIAAGGVVVHATEGVWGLACDPFNETAVGRLLSIKQREVDKGLIVIGGSCKAFEAELGALTRSQRVEVCATWPGAVSWVLAGDRFPNWVRGAHSGIAVRVPGHTQARELSQRAGLLVSTSANLAGQPPVVSQAEALEQFCAVVDVVLAGAVQQPGAVSRLQTLDGAILRP